MGAIIYIFVYIYIHDKYSPTKATLVVCLIGRR
jgi:hypothetical protein